MDVNLPLPRIPPQQSKIGIVPPQIAQRRAISGSAGAGGPGSNSAIRGHPAGPDWIQSTGERLALNLLIPGENKCPSTNASDAAPLFTRWERQGQIAAKLEKEGLIR